MPDTTSLLCSHHLHCSADLHICDLSDTPSCYAIIIFIVLLICTFVTYLTPLSCYAVIIFIVLLIFMFVTYTTSSKIGNIGVMYNNLTEVARLNPVAGNRGGSPSGRLLVSSLASCKPSPVGVRCIEKNRKEGND